MKKKGNWKRIPINFTIENINVEFIFQICIDSLKDPNASKEAKEYAETQLMHFGRVENARVHGLPKPKSPFVKEVA